MLTFGPCTVISSKQPNTPESSISTFRQPSTVAGPYTVPPFPSFHTRPFEAIPKRHQPGKSRLILDLPSPLGASVNDGILKDPFSIHYVSVDDAIRTIVALGPGAKMAKFDVQAAYRNVPIHPSDRRLLGMRLRGNYYVDLVLPFGLRSAPFIFDSVASAVGWILSHNYCVSLLFHYLDDFLTLDPPSSPVCQSNVNTAFAVFARLGLPLHHEKCKGPATCLVFLGMEFNSVTQTARLLDDKFARIVALLHTWSTKRTSPWSP